MDKIAVIIIFAICVCLLIIAYLVTAMRCSALCLKGIKAKKEENTEMEANVTVSVEEISATSSMEDLTLTIEEIKTDDLLEEVMSSIELAEPVIPADPDCHRVIIYCPGTVTEDSA